MDPRYSYAGTAQSALGMNTTLNAPCTNSAAEILARIAQISDIVRQSNATLGTTVDRWFGSRPECANNSDVKDYPPSGAMEEILRALTALDDDARLNREYAERLSGIA